MILDTGNVLKIIHALCQLYLEISIPDIISCTMTSCFNHDLTNTVNNGSQEFTWVLHNLLLFPATTLANLSITYSSSCEQEKILTSRDPVRIE